MFQMSYRSSLIPVFFLAALLLAGAQIVGSGPVMAASDDDKKTLMDAAAEERDKAVQAGERLLAKIDSKLQEVEQEIEKASADAKARWEEERQRLSAMREDADQRLNGLRESTDNAWDNFKQSFSESSDPRAPTLEAVVDASLGKCGQALPRLQAADQQDLTVSKLARLALARCAIAELRFDAALSALADLPAELADDPDLLYETARLHLKGWNAAVEDMFSSAPASFRVNQLSAEIFEIQGRYDDAVREYRKALQKAPATLNLHYRLGRALLMRSHEPEALTEALEEFRAELRLNPADAVAEFQVGQILQVLGKPDEALPHFERAVALDGEFPEALVALAKERSHLEDYDEAIALLERALALHPQSEPAHYSLMLAYRNAGRREDARRIQQALEALQAPTEGEFSDFLKRIGEAP